MNIFRKIGKLLCKIGLHNWEEYNTKCESPILFTVQQAGYRWTHYCRCKRCGKYETFHS